MAGIANINPLENLKPEHWPLKNQISSYLTSGENYDIYIIPAGTVLFKSFRNSLNEWKGFEPFVGPAFFGFNEETSRIYGYAFSYRTTREYRLLAIDSPRTLKYLYDLANEDEKIQNILKQNYGYKKIPQIRNSEGPNDWKFVQFLCSNNLNGYAANYIRESIPSSFFHPECVICEPDGIMLNHDFQENGIFGLATPSEFHLKIKCMLDERNAPKIRRKNKRPNRIDSPLRMGSSSLFGSDSPLRTGLLFFDDNSPIGQGSPQAGTPPRIGFPYKGSLFDSPNKRHKTIGGKTRKQKRNASKKGIKSLRNKSYNNVRRRKVSNRRN